MTTQETSAKEKEVKTEEPVKFTGKYINAIGRRKTAVARIRVYKKGTGVIMVNDKKINNYFTQEGVFIVKQPLKLSGNVKDINISINVKGGGKISQAEAARHGITRALIEMEEGLKLPLRIAGFITRDARRNERKKPGLKKARRAPQWSKR